jgi:hypothetical protein
VNRLERLQRASLWIAAAAALLALVAAAGRGPLPDRGGAWVWGLHPLVLALGAAAGALTTARHRQIDRERWERVQDSALTKGERQWAHQEAEAQRKRAAASFLASPVLLAGWFASHLRQVEPSLSGELLPITALAGYGLGLLGSYWRARRGEPGPGAAPSPGD